MAAHVCSDIKKLMKLKKQDTSQADQDKTGNYIPQVDHFIYSKHFGL